MNKYNFHDKPERIWNIDESGISTVLQAPKVLAAAGVKQVGQMVSNERGEQVTIVGIVNAAGGKAPPIYIFPRKRAKEEWMDGSPEGAISIFNGSGWMDKDGFLTTLKHIREHTAATKENPILILLDNHSSHTSLEVIIYCRENGIHMITFPPHTTHRCQPLDVAIFGPFKGRCKTEFNKWIAANPGKRITLHNVVKISAKAFSSSFSMSNIMSGFLKTGIFPLDREALSADLDNLAEVITAKDSCTVSQKEDSKPAISLLETKMSDSMALRKSPDDQIPISCGSNSQNHTITPEDVKPIPNPFGDTTKRQSKRKLISTILTSSPEKKKKEEQRNIPVNKKQKPKAKKNHHKKCNKEKEIKK